MRKLLLLLVLVAGCDATSTDAARNKPSCSEFEHTLKSGEVCRMLWCAQYNLKTWTGGPTVISCTKP